MKEFNLEEFKKNPSQKVVTRDGREVRIICTDAKGDEPIIALIYNKYRDEENVYTYNREGIFYKDNDSCLDLFFAPIKREGWINIYQDNSRRDRIAGDVFPSEKDAKEAIKDDPEFIATTKIEWEE